MSTPLMMHFGESRSGKFSAEFTLKEVSKKKFGVGDPFYTSFLSRGKPFEIRAVIYPGGFDDSSKGNVITHFELKGFPNDAYLKGKVQYGTTNGNSIGEKINAWNKYSRNGFLGPTNVHRRAVLRAIKTDDCLVVSASIEYSFHEVTVNNKKDKVCQLDRMASCTSMVENLLERSLPDILLTCADDVGIQTHSFLLRGHSLPLARLMDEDGFNNHVAIQNYDSDVVSAVLHYLLHSELPDSTREFLEIMLEMSNDYELEHLSVFLRRLLST